MPSPPVPAPRSLSVSSFTLSPNDEKSKSQLTKDDDIVSFNIGGQIYSTSRSTINQNVDSQSILALIINNRATNIRYDKDGYYFLDRDGTYFRYILNYFRDQKLFLPEGFNELKQLRNEAHFYQIDRLVDEIENCLNANNEHKKLLQMGIHFTLISNLNQNGRIQTLLGPLKIIRLFHLELLGRQFLKSISSLMTDNNQLSCQCTFPPDDKLICCQPFDQLQRLVLAKQARKMSMTVSYCDDYIYIPLEQKIMLRDQLAQILLNKYDGKLLHTNVTHEKKSYNNRNDDESYSLVENWFVPHVALAKCEETNGILVKNSTNEGSYYSTTSMTGVL